MLISVLISIKEPVLNYLSRFSYAKLLKLLKVALIQYMTIRIILVFIH